MCCNCPRNCQVNRIEGEKGACQAPVIPIVAKSTLHFWEEPCISGTNGSGTIFFSGCNLHCIFCQNHEISQKISGKKTKLQELMALFFNLQAQGAHNINLVTPTPYVVMIKQALINAKAKGLTIPIIYNTNGYEKVETIHDLAGLIDIYLPDIKYMSEELSGKFSGASDYFLHASAAIIEMHQQVGNLVINDKGIATKGLLLRHLILPGHLDESRKILDWVVATFNTDIHVSLMGQFVPVYKAIESKELNRTLTKREYQRMIEYFFRIGLKNGYCQELQSASTKFIPHFSLTNPLDG